MRKYFVNENNKVSIWKIIRNLFIALILAAAAFAGLLYGNVLDALDTVNQEVKTANIRHEDVNISEGDPINVLVVGTDGGGPERQEEDGFIPRSDTLMLVNLNPETEATKILSIPRDTLAMVENQPDKLNHAYAYGGVDLTVEVIQDYLQIPIDYYAVINMDGLIEVIDALGGIEITSPLSFEYRGTEFHKNERRDVDGVKAMNFARMRYDDPEGEVGRQNRQKIVVKAIIDKVLSLDAVANYPRLIKVVNSYVKTNVDLNDILSIYQKYASALNNISTLEFEHLEEIYIDDVFYFHIPVAARVKAANEFRYLSNMPLLTVEDFDDTFGEEITDAKSLTLIINQYPTGLSEEELNIINDSQQNLQMVREQEVRDVPRINYPDLNYDNQLLDDESDQEDAVDYDSRNPREETEIPDQDIEELESSEPDIIEDNHQEAGELEGAVDASPNLDTIGGFIN